eukprot:2659471-Amphidinium_carterae.1
MVKAFERQDPTALDRAFLSQLAFEGVVVKPPGDDHWWLSLGSVEGMAVCLWPLRHSTLENGTLLLTPSPKTKLDDVKVYVVNVPEEWKAIDTEWCSPLGLKLSSLSEQSYICLKSVGAAEPLLAHASKKGFWK